MTSDPVDADQQVSKADLEVPAALDIAKPLEKMTPDERSALRVVRILYVIFRDDWRRLFTCAHLWPLLVLFFLPWVNISCNDRSLVTQSGFQACYGARTIAPKFEKVMRNNDRGGLAPDLAFRPKLDEDVPWSALSILYILFVIGGAFFGLVCIGCVVMQIRIAAGAVHLFSLGLGGAAFAALALQMVIGFPIDKHTKEQMDKAKAEQDRRNAQFGVRPMPADNTDVFFDIGAKYTLWLWLSALLAFVSVPTFFLEFAVLAMQAVLRHLRPRSDSS